METIRQQDNVVPVDVETVKTISIIDLGVTADNMLEKWKGFKEEGIPISLKEFPTIDFMQTMDDKELMELILEFTLLVEINKKKIVKEKQAKGIAKAREKGIKLGRREKRIPDNFVDIYKNVLAKKITMKRATEILDADYKTYKKWVKQYKS